MGGFGVEIRIADGSAPAVPLGKVVVEHHRTPSAEITAEVLSGGHVLHLAVAICLFNDLLRMAAERGIDITDLRVSADGGFAGTPVVSTGISYDIDVAGNAPDDVLRELVADVERDAAIPLTLARTTPVTPGTLTVRPA